MNLKDIFKGYDSDYKIILDNMDVKVEAIRQYKTGYCWLTSGLFCINLKDGYSLNNLEENVQRLIAFDKIEKVRRLVSDIKKTLLSDNDDSVFRYLLRDGISDRGQWCMFARLVSEHGMLRICDCTAENVLSLLQTKELNAMINYIVRCCVAKIRGGIEEYSRDSILGNLNNLGHDLERIIKDYVYPADMTNLVASHFPFEEYICICCLGDRWKKHDTLYRVDIREYIGMRENFINISPEKFKESVIHQIDIEGFCWISCDSGKFCYPRIALWDDRCLDFTYLISDNELLNVDKGGVFEHLASSMNHAMVLTGYSKGSLNDTYFKVIDGSDAFSEFKGNANMSESWFDKFVFQAIVHKHYMSDYNNIDNYETI